MFGDWHSFLVTVGCLLCVGAAVKLMDDYLDVEYDVCRGVRTCAARLGRATLPYALVLTILGAYLNLPVTIAVFLAAYGVGMLAGWNEKMPTHLPAYIEIIIAAGLSILLSGWEMTLWAFSMMAVIDWLDDLMDVTHDRTTGQRNMALRAGFVETLLLLLLALFAAVMSNAVLTAMTFVVLVLLTMLSEMTTTNLWNESSGNEMEDES